MSSNTKSSVTLPAHEVRLVKRLKARLKLKNNVAVIRAGLKLLDESTERAALREAFRSASRATRADLVVDLADLDHLTGEGLD